MAALLSGTSQNVPSMLGFEMIFREDYFKPAIGTFRDVPSFESHHLYNVASINSREYQVWRQFKCEHQTLIY